MNDDDGTLPSFVAASLRDRVPGKAYAPDAPYAPYAWPSSGLLAGRAHARALELLGSPRVRTAAGKIGTFSL
jgi:hypothetical protein